MTASTNPTISASLLGVPVTVSAPPPLMARIVAELGVLLDSDSDSDRYPVPPLHLLQLRDDGTADGTADAGYAVENALAQITGFAVAHSPLLCIHAGVVAGARGLIAIPGASGHGKTTLVAALVRAGFGYVSDEALALDRSSLIATAFPRPLALDRRAWALLGLDPAAAPPDGGEGLVQPDALGALGRGGAVTDIVLTRRRPGPATLGPTSRGTALAPLLSRAFNHYLDGAASFRAVVTLVRGARVWAAEYEQAPDLAVILAERLGPGKLSGPQPGRPDHSPAGR